MRRRPRLVLVGGAGRMARRLAPLFRRRGYEVVPSDPHGPRSMRRLPASELRDAEVVVIAASLSRSGEALDAVASAAPRGLVLDIASVKAPLLPAIRRARRAGISIASVHPLFGPGVRSLRGRDLIVCDTGDARAAARARRLFSGERLVIRTMPIEEHDRWIARTLGLAQLVALTAAAALADLGIPGRPERGLAAASFLRLLTLVDPVLDQEPELTASLQTLNPGSGGAARALEREARRWRERLERGGPAFEAALRDLSRRLAAHA